MDIPFYQIDAFADAPFKGNPAAVMVLEADLNDNTLQAIAAENNLSETAFISQYMPDAFALRWFTPTTEVALCGHATLAAAHVVLSHLGGADHVKFETRKSGVLTCTKTANGYSMDFPAMPATKADSADTTDPKWHTALGAKPQAIWYGNFTAVQLATLADLTALNPDIDALAHLGSQASEGAGNIGVFAIDPNTKTGDTPRIVSRFFAPGCGIDEDPATGSWHCLLATLGHELTGKSTFTGYQAFPSRGADIGFALSDTGRVTLTGNAVTLIEGVFRV